MSRNVPERSAAEYDHARENMGKRFSVKCNRTKRIREGLMVGWVRAPELVSIEDGERARGAVRLIIRTDDGQLVESISMTPA